MAAALVVPATADTRKPVAISGTGWAVSTDVSVLIDKEDITFVIASDGAGAFNAAPVFRWLPKFPGKYTITANDGASTVVATVKVSTAG